MKKKKRIITTLGLLLIAIVGATFAYYTSNTSFENVFNAGKYKVTLTEVFESPDNWVPGETVPKTVTAKNDGTVPAAVRISYTEQWTKEIDGVETDITNQVTPNPAIINFDNQDDWTLSNGYYYYKYILEPTDETSSFISGVTLDPNLDSVTCTGEGNTKTCEAQNKASGAKYKLTFTIQTVQYDQYQSIWQTNVEITEKPRNAVSIVSGTKGNLRTGDIVGIGETEDFYVISSDNSEGGKTVLFAKYGLITGPCYSSEELPGTTYGLQSEEVGTYIGCVVGRTEFSRNNYWMDGDNLLSKYDPDGLTYLDKSNSKSKNWVFRNSDSDSESFPYVYDENSYIYGYLNGADGYINKLKSMGAPSTITGRLLTEDELDFLQSTNSSLLDSNNYYWVGYARNNEWLDIVSGTTISKAKYGDYSGIGVRPVIEIPTSEIE